MPSFSTRARVHVARVEVTDLALRSCPARAFALLALSNSSCSALRLFSRSSWNAPQLEASAGICGFLEPPAVHVAEEVVLWADGVIEVGGVDAARERLLRGRGDGDRADEDRGERE